MLLSASSVITPASAVDLDAEVATTELEIIAETWGSFSDPRIDEIRLVADEIQVYSTTEQFHSLPGDPSLGVPATPLKSAPVRVTVPDRQLSIVHFFANSDQPRSELYSLRTSGNSTLLYRRPNADADSGWLLTDIDPGPGSSVGLDFTPAPAAPQGLMSIPVSGNSGNVTLYFDETPASTFAGQRFVRRYEIRIETPGLWIPDSQVVAFDHARFTWTDDNGTAHSFGGTKSIMLSEGVYSWSVRVQDLPVFPDGATGNNALATLWSDWSEASRFTVLPPGEQILVGNLATDYETSTATIEWGPVDSAASYEVWVNRLSDGKQILHKSGLSGFSYQTEPLDPDNYRVWVRATRSDGTRTTWSKPKAFNVQPPYPNITGPNPTHQWTFETDDATAVIEWKAVPHSTKYTITLIDSAKEQAAASMDFDSPEAYRRFITAYSRSVAGSSSSHTVETPLAPSLYRIELTLSFANGTTTQTTRQLRIEPVGVPIPVASNFGVQATDSLRWNAEPGVASYDVWVAYLHGDGEPTPGSPAAPGQWRFATKDEVTAGSWQLPANAPAGRYRIWLRPNRESGDQSIKGAWNTPADFTSRGPLYRAINVTVQGEKLTWEPVPGASGYRVNIDHGNGTAGNNPMRVFNITSTGFEIPDDFIDGTYSVRVGSLDGSGQTHSYAKSISIQHGRSPWTWSISKPIGSIEWNPVPDAVRYEVQILALDGNVIIDAPNVVEPQFSLTQLEAGHFSFKVRALRSVNGDEFLTAWASHTFDNGISTPTNVRLNGTIVTWDAQENTRYEVLIEIENGILGSTNLDTGPITAVYPPRRYFSRGKAQADGNSIDLSDHLSDLYSYDRIANVKISVQAISRDILPWYGISLPLSSEWSEPVLLPLSQAAWIDPIVETAARPKPSAPRLVLYDGQTILVPPEVHLPSDTAQTHIYRTENGAAIDLEYVRRFQLRVTDMQSGVVRTFDESQIPELLQMQDEFESPVLNYNGYPIILRIATLVGSTDSWITQPGLGSSVYKVEARVQYLPVILSASTSDPYKFSLADTQADHINVSATPWSDWSSPLEYTILPDGQSILPLSKSPTTVNQRPTFAWGSNTANAQYELWVENRVTKQRVLHETLSNIREFQSPTDLPAGQYDWWVRIVGTTGPRHGWSAKQSLDIFAPAITISVAVETVDATPAVSWSAASGAQSYVVTFTSTTTGKVVYQATEAAGRTTHRVSTILPNDTYSVSIQASLPNGARTAPGAVNASGGFVLKRMIVGAAPKSVTLSTSKVTWQTVAGATRYDVWINYIDSTGKTERILRQDALGTALPLSASLTNRPGEYRVWIRAIRSEAGQEYTGRWSEVKSLQVNSASPDSSALAIIMSEFAITGVLDGAAST